MTSALQNGGAIEWSSVPRDYQWKATISVNCGTWSVLAHCKPLKCDVFIKIKQLEMDDSDTDLDALAENINNLINLHHTNLLTPVHSFHAKNDIWIIYPLSSGGPLSELLKNHYPNGIPDESIVACILKDAAEGLQYLHKHQIVHRNIRASSLHVNCLQGITLLTEFDVLKEIKFKHAKSRQNTLITINRYPWTDPLILSHDPNISWFQGDVYSFGVTALELVFGDIPPSKSIPKIDMKQFVNSMNYEPVSIDSYNKPCTFSKSYHTLIEDCCSNRMNIKQLLKHAFFKKACDRFKIKREIGHLIKKTELRINSSFLAPACFPNSAAAPPVETHSAQFDYNASLSMSMDSDSKPENVPNQNVSNPNVSNQNVSNQNVSEPCNPVLSIMQEQIQEQQKTQPSMHVKIAQINGDLMSRITRVSFSASDSNSEMPAEEASPIAEKVSVSDQRGRFNVEVLNTSGGNEHSLSSISEEQPPPAVVSDEDNDNEQEITTKSTMYGRFAVAKGNTPSTSNYSYQMNFDESAIDNVEVLMLIDNVTDPPQPSVLHENKSEIRIKERNMKLNMNMKNVGNVIKWTVDDCAKWLSTLGASYVQYQGKFISNGIDGVLMKSLDDEMLKEIVPSKLHRTKIILSAKVLFPNVSYNDNGNGHNVYDTSL